MASPAKLQAADIAEMNLLCAEGLPGARDLDVDRCLATLDSWADRPALNPTALSVTDTARVLSAAQNGEVTAEMLQADDQAGAPTNADGTLNLVRHTVRLIQGQTCGDRSGPTDHAELLTVAKAAA